MLKSFKENVLLIGLKKQNFITDINRHYQCHKRVSRTIQTHNLKMLKTVNKRFDIKQKKY